MITTSNKSAITTLSCTEAKNYNGIDLIKFLCAILVLIIHSPPFSDDAFFFAKFLNWGLKNFVCRIAVPFFFVSSGFFLFRKMSLYDLNVEKIKSYCFRILQLLGVWCALLFVGGIDQLWYLEGTVIAVILLSLCLHYRMKLRTIGVLACLLYAICLLGTSYYGLIEPISDFPLFKLYHYLFDTTRNGIFMGFIFIFMGALFAQKKIKLKPLVSFFGFAASMLCMFFEMMILSHFDLPECYDAYLFLLPATFFLFAFASTIQCKDRPLYKRLRTVGVLIYFLHLLVQWFVVFAMEIIYALLNLPVHYPFPLTLPLTFLFTLSIAFFVEWLSHKEKCKWINWLV